jgi:hypothetical protein
MSNYEVRLRIARSAVVVAAGFAFFGLASNADAAFKIRLDDGIGLFPDLEITDQGVGDLSPIVGNIVVADTIGTWTFTFTSTRTKPLSGSATQPVMTISSDNTSGLGVLTIYVTDTGYGPTAAPTNWTKSVNGADDDSQAITYDAYYDTGNTEFALTTAIGGQLSGTGEFDASDSDVTPAGLASPFSLTTVYTITHTVQGSSQFDADLRTLPEPATLGVLGIGLFGLGWAARRRRRTMVN